jgi:hypothetical protein
VKITGATDNIGNSFILARLMSTKFPLLIVLGELAMQLQKRDLSLDLVWAPRLQNEEADALTNADYSGFAEGKRIHMDVASLEFLVMGRLQEVSEHLYQDIVARRGSAQKAKSARTGPRVRLKARDPWL